MGSDKRPPQVLFARRLTDKNEIIHTIEGKGRAVLTGGQVL
jgi:hypothetical protein